MDNNIQAKIYKIIECIIFFCLIALAAFFMFGVLEHYFSRKSNFTQSEEKIIEHPTITICFSSNGDFVGDVEYQYGSDFRILLYYYNSFTYDWFEQYLKEGNNLFDMNETLKLEMVLTKFAGICYKIRNIQHTNLSNIFYAQSQIELEKLH